MIKYNPSQCDICGLPASPGRDTCAECARKRRENLDLYLYDDDVLCSDKIDYDY